VTPTSCGKRSLVVSLTGLNRPLSPAGEAPTFVRLQVPRLMPLRLARFPRVLLLVGGLACSASSPEEGYYRLRTLNDVHVPYDDTQGCCIYTGGFLRLDNTEYDVSIYFQNRNNSLVDTAFENGSYRIRGDTILFDPVGGNFPLSLFGAARSGDTIQLRLGGDDPGAADQFDALFKR
jgi:hypothetical protein